MKIILSATASALALSSPAFAQEMDHSMHGHQGQHDSMDMSGNQSPPSNPAPMDHSMHTGHAMPKPAGDAAPAADHSGHNMQGGQMNHGPAAGDPPKKPVDARAFSGPAHVADLTYDPAVMAKVRDNMIREHGGMTIAKFMLDRVETKIVDGKDGYAWEGDAWIGKDIDKLWIKSAGEGTYGLAPEQAEVQALWSHAIGPWFDLQMGARHNFRPDPDRTYAVVGVQGLLPYWLEASGALFLSEKGDVTARAEVEYDLRITPDLIVQPRVEMNLAAQNIPEIGVGAGITNAELGVRVRYHISQQFAPYVGVQWENSFGRTRRYIRAEGEDPSQVALVLGARFWF